MVSLLGREGNGMVWHLSVIELLALRDGVPAEKKARRMKAHLAGCLPCQSRAAQIEDNLRDSCSLITQDASVTARLGAAKKELQKAIRTRRSQPGGDSTRDRRSRGHNADTGAQLAAELKAYLGPRLTTELIRQVDLSRENDLVLFQKIGPMLTALLGQDAALEVATRLYRILVLDRRLKSSSSSHESSERPVQEAHDS